MTTNEHAVSVACDVGCYQRLSFEEKKARRRLQIAVRLITKRNILLDEAFRMTVSWELWNYLCPAISEMEVLNVLAVDLVAFNTSSYFRHFI